MAFVYHMHAAAPKFVFLKNMHNVLVAEKDSPCAAFELGLQRVLSNAPARVSESRVPKPILVHSHSVFQGVSPVCLLANTQLLINI